MALTVFALLAPALGFGLEVAQVQKPFGPDLSAPVWHATAAKAVGTAKPAAQGRPQGRPSAAPKVPELKSISDLCRMREFQLVNQNVKILTRSIDAASETDPAKQKAILNAIITSKRSLEELEQSWSRLSCATYITKFDNRQGMGSR